MDKKKQESMLKIFLQNEYKKIHLDKQKEHKESEGQEYDIKWIKENAQWFRDSWNNCLCCNCSNNENCGYLLLSACKGYKNDQN